MDTCVLEGCNRPLNRDGLCFHHKVKTLSFGTHEFAQERRGEGPGGDMTDRQYAESIYKHARENGKPDPIPANKKAAALAPAAGVLGNTKKYKEANNGL